MTPRLETALAYAAQGIPVFACEVSGKRPAPVCPHGFKNRTTDPAVIQGWFSVADWNIAIVPEDIACGVVDVDPRHGGNNDGLAPTYRVKTPSGGTHHYYLGSLPGSVGKNGHKLGPGRDTRGRASYVLVAPSYVIDEEKGYEGPYVAEGGDYAPMPEWIGEVFEGEDLEARIAPDGTIVDTDFAIAKGREWLALQEQATYGNASDVLYRHAARLKDFAISRERGIELLAEHHRGYWPDDIAVRVGNAFEYGKNEEGCDTPQPASVVYDLVAPPEPIGRIARPYGGAEGWLARECRPVQWVVSELIAERAPNLVTGQTSVGKTTWLLNLIVSALAGRDFIGRSTRAQQPEGSLPESDVRDCVLFAAEDDYGPLREHLHAICDERHIDRSVLGRLHIRSLLGEPLEDGYLARVDDYGNWAPLRAYDAFIEYLRKLDRPLLMLDPLSELIAFNRYADMSARRMVTHLLEGICREGDATIVATDHPSIASIASGRDVGGSYQMESAFPVVHTLKGDEAADTGQRMLQLVTKKNRFMPQPWPSITFYRRRDEYAFRDDPMRGTAKEDYMRLVYDFIVVGLRAFPAQYVNQWSARLRPDILTERHLEHDLHPLKAKQIRQTMQDLLDDGWLIRADGAHGTPTHLMPNPRYEPGTRDVDFD